MAAAGPAGWKNSVRRRKQRGLVPGAWYLVVGWCTLTSLHIRARADRGAICVLQVWCHQHTGDICPLVTLFPCPDGAKSLLSVCQLRHGMQMPAWWLTLKLGWPRGHMQGSGRQGGAACGSCFREMCTFIFFGKLQTLSSLFTSGPRKCFCFPQSHFYFAFSM